MWEDECCVHSCFVVRCLFRELVYKLARGFFCPEGAKKVWRSDEVEVSGDDFFEKKEKNAFAIQTYLAEKRLFCTPMQI